MSEPGSPEWLLEHQHIDDLLWRQRDWVDLVNTMAHAGAITAGKAEELKRERYHQQCEADVRVAAEAQEHREFVEGLPWWRRRGARKKALWWLKERYGEGE